MSPPDPSHARDLRLESFESWLARQIQAAHSLYYNPKTPATKKRRYWDQLLLLQGVQAEYERRITR
jgi:hypothetical protein